MKKLILATVAIVGFSGAALAQEAPALIYGDAFQQNVQNATEDFGVTFSGRASIGAIVDNASPAPVGNINASQNYSGR